MEKEYTIPEYLYVVQEVYMAQDNMYLDGYRVRDYKPWDYSEPGDYKVKVPSEIKTKDELIAFAKEKFKDAKSLEIDGKYIYTK